MSESGDQFTLYVIEELQELVAKKCRFEQHVDHFYRPIARALSQGEFSSGDYSLKQACEEALSLKRPLIAMAEVCKSIRADNRRGAPNVLPKATADLLPVIEAVIAHRSVRDDPDTCSLICSEISQAAVERVWRYHSALDNHDRLEFRIKTVVLVLKRALERVGLKGEAERMSLV